MQFLGTISKMTEWSRFISKANNWTSQLLFSHSVVSDFLQSHELQHARRPCPSPSPRVCSNSCPLNRWCHLTVSSSVISFSCLQPFLASRSFPMSWLFTSGDQRTRVSASASVLPMNISGLISFGTDWFDLLAVQGTLKSLFQHHNLKESVLQHPPFFMVQFSHRTEPT